MSIPESEAADWAAAWEGLTPDKRAVLTRLIDRYGDFLAAGYRTTTTPAPAWETLLEVNHWQALEVELLEAHSAWLVRTKEMFDRRGWPWTTAELAARSHLREVGE